MDPNADPFAAPTAEGKSRHKFGASDVMDLTRTQLLNAIRVRNAEGVQVFVQPYY